MPRLKKTAIITLALFLLSGMLAAFPAPVSADFLSTYQVLKKDYGYVIDRIIAGGATEAEIEKFLVDLEKDVKARGELTVSSFNSLMYRSFEEVIQWRTHRNVFRALLESYGDEIEYTLENETLHPELIPIRNAVFEALLGEDGKPPAGGESSSGGGGSNPSITPNNDINQAISSALTTGETIITVDVSQYDELIFPGSLLGQVNQKGKTLVLEWPGVKLSLPPGAIADPGSERVIISAKKLSPAKAAEAAQKAGTALQLLGNVFDIKVATVNMPEGILFSRPIDITLNYDGNEESVGQKTWALYFYNEKNQNWEKLAGEHDRSAGYIRISTNQPGKYALFAAAGAQTTPDPEISNNFIDIRGHWAEKDINTMYQLGLISGVTAFQFEPERSITRAEFAAIMLRALKEQPGNYMTGRYYDVPADAWYFNVVNKATDIGIIAGYSSTSFGPQDSITREQIAAIISRAMQLKDKGSVAKAESNLVQFADQGAISDWARGGVEFAVENQIVMGRGNAQFAPLATATRAEAAAMILRMYRQL